MTLKQKNCQNIGIYLLPTCPISMIKNIYSQNPFEVLEGYSGHENMLVVTLYMCA